MATCSYYSYYSLSVSTHRLDPVVFCSHSWKIEAHVRSLHGKEKPLKSFTLTVKPEHLKHITEALF